MKRPFRPRRASWLHFKALDFAAAFIALGLIVLSCFLVYGAGKGRLEVYVKGENREWVYPLNAEETIDVSGPLGVTVVRISDGYAWVKSSPCPNQICVQMGRIHKAGQYVACLPNKVMVYIKGEQSESQVDAW